jgi:hypothetical protein
VLRTDLRRSLWRSGGEEDEDFLEEWNCGDIGAPRSDKNPIPWGVSGLAEEEKRRLL